jgi:hypothetical protein
MLNNGIYIYGIVPNTYSAEMFGSIHKSGVYTIPFNDLSAIVSNWESLVFDLSDRESLGYLLAHHQKTIETIMAKGFNVILPVKFRTIVYDIEDVFSILSKGHDLITNALKNIENLTEVDLAVTWADFGGILNEVANQPEIVAMKNNILNNIDKISHIDQVKIGMLIHEKLNEKNKHVEHTVLDTLSPICLNIKNHDVMNDQMITNSAFLINRSNKEQFESTIEQLDAEFKDLLNFKLVGPLPCYSFYTVEVKSLNPEQVVQAKKGLGLRDETTESEIKKAYLEKAKQFHPDNSTENVDTENFNMIQSAFHTLLDYTAAAKQSSKDNFISLSKEKVVENLILVKIKE